MQFQLSSTPTFTSVLRLVREKSAPKVRSTPRRLPPRWCWNNRSCRINDATLTKNTCLIIDELPLHCVKALRSALKYCATTRFRLRTCHGPKHDFRAANSCETLINLVLPSDLSRTQRSKAAEDHEHRNAAKTGVNPCYLVDFRFTAVFYGAVIPTADRTTRCVFLNSRKCCGVTTC
jgi:hypothetical protein